MQGERSGNDSWWGDVGRLYEGLSKGLNLISGLQQPDDPTVEDKDDFFKKERSLGWEEVEAIAADLVCGLLGPDYRIVKIPRIDAEDK